MARPLRIEYAGAFHHVMNRGLERREIFRDEKDCEAFLSLCLDIHKRFKVILHAYSLMPNHYHLMVETPEGNLSRAMRHLDGVYTQGFNRRRRGRGGPLFQGRYKAILIDKEAYSLELSRYIHLNPVKAKITRRAQDHPYSSFRYYLGKGRPPEFLETDWLLGQFHKNARTARMSFYQFTMEGLRASWSPEEGLKGGMILGGEDFFERIRKRYLEGKVDREIPDLRKSRRIPEVKEIQSCVEGCCEEEGMRKRLLVWALKRHTPLKLREIAERIESSTTYSAVAQICRRLEQKSLEDKKLRGMMSRIDAEMSNVKT